ncbi:hypothetical protein [Spirillospora sp. NPDC048819]|uniref:hypothetical protein n=1 Tax=Spirillospora sp. NPDC048819 TaxID=3155268 RepID=UPI0034068095
MTTPGDAAAGSADPWVRFLAALETGCGTCGGTGKTVREEWRLWHRQADELVRVAQAARRAADLNPDTTAYQHVPHGPGGHGPGGQAPGGQAPGGQAPGGQAPGGQGPAGPAAEPSIVAAIDRAIDDHMKARPQGPEEETCRACRGCGTLLTAAGHHLADLLARHGFVREK